MSKIQVYLVWKNLFIQMNYFILLVHLKHTVCDMSNLRNETTHSWSPFFLCTGSDVLCLTLNSLGIQTCGENDSTNWRIQDCSPSKVQTEVYPYGWYEKPGISKIQVKLTHSNSVWLHSIENFSVCKCFKHQCVSVVNQWIKNPSVCPPFSLRSPIKNGKRLVNEYIN